MPFDLYSDIDKPDEKKKIVVASALENVVFEPIVPHCSNGNKQLFTFNESLRTLRERGYQRHPRPAETFALICAGLEGKLQPEQQAIVKDMFFYSGEWLSMAMKLEGNLLHCYLDPENIVWDAEKWQYVVDGSKLRHSGESVYSIGSLYEHPSTKKLNDINPSLVEFLWSRPYACLPEEIRQCSMLYLPNSGRIYAVSRNSWLSKFTVGCADYYAKSRGIR